MGNYIPDSLRTQPTQLPPLIGYFGLKPLLNEKEISLQLQLGGKYVPIVLPLLLQTQIIIIIIIIIIMMMIITETPTWQVATFLRKVVKSFIYLPSFKLENLRSTMKA